MHHRTVSSYRDLVNLFFLHSSLATDICDHLIDRSNDCFLKCLYPLLGMLHLISNTSQDIQSKMLLCINHRGICQFFSGQHINQCCNNGCCSDIYCDSIHRICSISLFQIHQHFFTIFFTVNNCRVTSFFETESTQYRKWKFHIRKLFFDLIFKWCLVCQKRLMYIHDLLDNIQVFFEFWHISF